MKGRLNSTIVMLVVVNFVALIAVLGLAYSAGAKSGGLGLFDAFSAPGSPTPILMFAPPSWWW
jgi:hypothetical protein